MSTLNSLRGVISHVILDLDGTLLNTDGIVIQVLKVFLARYGKKWDSKKAHIIVGKTPIEAAIAVVEDYELPCTIEDFMSTTTPMFSDQLCNIKALPGANRLIKHLRSKGVPFGLASNSPRQNIEAKISYHHGWKDSFCAIVGGNEVENGKPSPDVFLEAARRMKVDPLNCLVIEDSLILLFERLSSFVELLLKKPLLQQRSTYLYLSKFRPSASPPFLLYTVERGRQCA